MKTHVTLLAFCLLGASLVNGQSTTNTNSSSTTTTNSTNGATPMNGTNSSGTMNGTSPSGTSTNDGSTMSNGTTNSTGSMNSSGTMNNGSTGGMNTSGTMTNSSATPAIGTTTTTTTTSTNSTNMGTTMSGDVNTRENSGNAWGKSGKFGVYAGVNFSRFVNEPIPDGAYRAGYQIGIYGRSGGTVFGQLGLEYRRSTSGLVRNGTTATSAQVRGKIDQQFVAIPAYIGIRIGSALGLRLQAGAELSALVRHPNNEFKITEDDVRRTMLNGLLGAGINLGPLTLDAVYNHGFSYVFEGQDTRRNLLALNLGLRF